MRSRDGSRGHNITKGDDEIVGFCVDDSGGKSSHC